MPTLSSGAPIFAVTDLSAAVEFYTDKLGFAVFMETTDPVPYAIVRRDKVSIHLMVDESRRGK